MGLFPLQSLLLPRAVAQHFEGLSSPSPLEHLHQ